MDKKKVFYLLARPTLSPARLIAFESLCAKGFLDISFSQYKEGKNLSKKDLSLAYEIAHGVVRWKITLNYFISQIQDKIKLKTSLRTLLQMALYQYLFMDKIPFYAICDQTIELAKKKKLQNVGFLHVLLRKCPATPFCLPIDKKVHSLSICFSYTEFFVDCLIEQWSKDKAIEYLQNQNKVYRPFIRVRRPHQFIQVQDKQILNQYKNSTNHYVQNPTFYRIMSTLQNHIQEPKTILDLCSSPGGKLLMVHDLFSKAQLFANEKVEKRLHRLEENNEKYQLHAEIFSFDGQKFPLDQKFDLILLDVPCSNSGVLSKRVEARYRIEKLFLEEITDLQYKLLMHAKKLLNDQGAIWYITCSILKQENEHMIAKMLKHNMHLKGEMLQYFPDDKGNDGGFGACLVH